MSTGFEFRHSTLNLENYWARVIEPLRNAAWYNSVRPNGRDADAWDFRAALVDAIVYAGE